MRTACAYEYPGCAMPASAVPSSEIISHGICPSCKAKFRAGEPIPEKKERAA